MPDDYQLKLQATRASTTVYRGMRRLGSAETLPDALRPNETFVPPHLDAASRD
ncbi:hypothetical protein SS05631_c30370 [Sinorhizobium sp. CCBAU 05631]|nr:hypothetical protein SS05631_c30370 [Sinorhizobium sp. CCBAU 05631]